MTYMSVKLKNSDVLHLTREPGLRSWSVFFAILSIGLGIVAFSQEGDSNLWKMFCLCCGILGAVLSLDEWEECILDKKNDLVQLKSLSLVEKIVFLRRESSNVVTACLSHVTDVQIGEDDVRMFGKAKCLLLVFNDGYSLPLTVQATKGYGENHLAILKVIQDFLHFDEDDKPPAEPDKIEEEKPPVDEDSLTTSSSVSSFEKLPADDEEAD